MISKFYQDLIASLARDKGRVSLSRRAFGTDRGRPDRYRSKVKIYDDYGNMSSPNIRPSVFLQNTRTSNTYKQDPKLTSAIDAIWREGIELCSPVPILPSAGGSKRRMSFSEVRLAVSASRLSHSQPGGRGNSSAEKCSTKDVTEDDERRKELIKKIEQILADINKTASEGKTPKFTIRNQRLWTNCVFSDRLTLKASSEARMSTVTYVSGQTADRFHALVYVLMKVHELLQNDTSCTKRELYYQDVSRWGTGRQSRVDGAVRDACSVLDAPPWELHVLATAKGLVAGPLTLRTRDGHHLDCMTAGGVLIPQDVSGIQSMKSSAKYILVVEKDATFQKLLDEDALARIGPCILLTGKGYPDVQTRMFLRRLVLTLRLRALALTDADAHGLDIMLTYRYGSLTMSHLAHELAVPSLRWLGVRPLELSALGAERCPQARGELARLERVLERPYARHVPAVLDEIRRALEDAREERGKAEIEGVGAITQCYLTDKYLPNKLIARDYI